MAKEPFLIQEIEFKVYQEGASMSPEIVYHVQSAPFWDWRVALDLFLGGAGVGALCFAFYIDAMFHNKYRRIGHTAAWLAPVLIAAGLGLVLLKMGRPFHLFLAYTTINPTAPLWWGGIFQPLLVVGTFVYALTWKKGEARTGPGWLGWTLLPMGVIVGAYHGLLLSTMPSRPLWDTGPVVVMALLGFLTTGIAIVMLAHLVRMKLAGRLVPGAHLTEFLHDMLFVRNALWLFLALQLGTMFLWWLSLLLGGTGAVEALHLANRSYGPLMWGVGIGLGMIVPLVLVAASLVKEKRKGGTDGQVAAICITSICILLGGLCFRYALLMAGQADLPLHLNF